MRLRSLILSIVVTILLSGCSSVKSFFGSSKKQQRQKAGTEVVAENISARTSESDGNSLSENLKSDNNVCAIPGVERPEAMIKPLKARPEMSFGETESANVRIPLRYNNPFPESGELVVPLCELETEFCYPYPGKLISPFGRRGRSNHTGIDIKAIPNDTIRAAMPGVVRMSKPYSGYGNLVVIRHYNGIETVYAHQSRNLVRVNDVVEAGDPIGLAGRTGRPPSTSISKYASPANRSIRRCSSIRTTVACAATKLFTVITGAERSASRQNARRLIFRTATATSRFLPRPSNRRIKRPPGNRRPRQPPRETTRRNKPRRPTTM